MTTDLRRQKLDSARLALQLAEMDATIPAGPPGSPARLAQERAVESAKGEYERLRERKRGT